MVLRLFGSGSAGKANPTPGARQRQEQGRAILNVIAPALGAHPRMPGAGEGMFVRDRGGPLLSDWGSVVRSRRSDPICTLTGCDCCLHGQIFGLTESHFDHERV